MTHTLLDYDGEPVTIEDGEIFYHAPPNRYDADANRIIYLEWDSDSREWVEPPFETELAPLSKSEYDAWCNS